MLEPARTYSTVAGSIPSWLIHQKCLARIGKASINRFTTKKGTSGTSRNTSSNSPAWRSLMPSRHKPKPRNRS